MSELGEENIFEWIRSLNIETQTNYFSHLARELTVCFRAYFTEEKVKQDEKMVGMYAFNEIQHCILYRILPAKTIGSDDAEIIMKQIFNLGSKNKILGSHIMAGLSTAKKRLDCENG